MATGSGLFNELGHELDHHNRQKSDGKGRHVDNWPTRTWVASCSGEVRSMGRGGDASGQADQ